MDYFLGEIRLFPYSRIPRGWLECNGALLQVTGNQALFSLLTNHFGGDGKTNFALPDLRGRVPVGVTQPQLLGKTSGAEAVALTIAQTPAHTHQVNVYDGVANMKSPTGSLPASSTKTGGPTQPPAPNLYGSFVANGQTMDPAVIGGVGGQAHENLQPSLALVYCISSSGIYPQRP